MSTSDNLLVSDDAGVTWTTIALPTLSKQVMPYRAVLTPGGKYLYVTVGNDAGPGWTNGGAVTRGAFLRYDTDAKKWVNLSPENTIKNGYNWIEGESIHWAGSIEFDPFNTKRVLVTSGNGIYMADDFGANKKFEFHFCVRGLEETVPNDIITIPGGPAISVIYDYDGFVHADISKPVSGGRHSPQMGNTTGIDYAKLSPNIVVRAGGNDETGSKFVFPLYYSTDTAKTWTRFDTIVNPSKDCRGKVAVSSDGKVVLWNPEGKDYLFRTDDWGKTWTTSTGISSNKCFPKADPLDANVFYAFKDQVYISKDKGVTFTAAGSRSISWTTDMEVTPGRSGHIWVAGYSYDGINGGFLARSIDGGKTWADVDPASDPAYTQRIQHTEAIGFGKEAPGASYPAIYIYGTIGGVKGIWQSIDEAKSWTRIDDDQHQYGSLANGGFVRGDLNTFGVVYRSTAGRGIAARTPSSWLTTGVKKQVLVNNTRHADYVSMTSNNLKLNASNKSGILNVAVYNLNGRLVYSNAVKNSIVLPVGSMVKTLGMYIINVSNKGEGIVFSTKVHIVR